MSTLIIGAGLIGGSIGLALRQRGERVLIRDASPGTVRLATELGVGESADDAAPDLVVVATPPDVTAAVVIDALREFPEAVVLDVASVKDSIQNRVLEAATDPARYVGTHPMAGREMSGVVAARSDLFLGRPFVLVPHEQSAANAITAAERFGHALGSFVMRMEAAAHDEAVAYVSHTPQLVASLLAGRLQEAAESSLSLAGQGLRDTTRIAHSDPRLWVEILSANAPAIQPILAQLHEDLGHVVRSFDELVDPDGAPGSRAVIARTIASGNLGVARIPGKHGSGTDSFAQFTVLVPDEPGQIGRLLTDMGEAGINVEDLRLEHSLGQPVGLAHVSVLKRDEARMRDMLAHRGWAHTGQD